MKRNLLFHLLFMMSLSVCAQPKISLFCDHVESIAQQENISFREAAQKVRNLGYQGLDVSISLSADKLKVLDELGLEHACAISWMDYYKGEQKELEDQTLDFMQKNGYDKVLVVPGFRTADAPKNAEQKVYARLKKFTERAQALGLKVMVEDFDNPTSPCYGEGNLNRLFAASPSTEHVFDTGNYVFAGDDVMSALANFRNRISHVHLKDRLAAHDSASPAIGTGVVPMTAVIRSLQDSGYDGWLTVEHYGSRRMLQDATLSIRFVETALKDKDFPKTEGMNPGMSEYWSPQPKLVAPGEGMSAPVEPSAVSSYIWSGASRRTSVGRVRLGETVACICKISMRFRFWTATTTLHM